MQKNYVLDTNILLHDAHAIQKFEDNIVVIPIYVIEEIDRFKKQLNGLGRNAREVSRLIDEHRTRGNLYEGVPMDHGGILRVLTQVKKVDDNLLKRDKNDDLILGVALYLQETERDRETILITKDTNMRIRADALGLKAENYDPESIDIDELYPGHRILEVSSHWIDMLYQDQFIDLNLFQKEEGGEGLYANEYVLLKSMDRSGHVGLGRVDIEKKILSKLNYDGRREVWGIHPRNKDQHYALDCLLDDDILLVTLLGKAGTGKTLLALAAGLQKSLDEEKYQRLLVSRPIFPLGRDLGYLPGSVEEKLNPWMQPIFDNIEYLMGLTQKDKKAGRSYKEMMHMGMIQIEPLTYIRGRSIPNQFILVDEAQNLTPHEVKTIITRAGEGTKIVLTGDPYQIDHPYIDAQSNGLTYVVNKFKHASIAASVTLYKGERSALAELAANLL